MVAMVRRGRQQQHVPDVLPHGFGQLEVVGLADLVALLAGGQMMGFVKNDQVPPRRGQQPLHTGLAL